MKIKQLLFISIFSISSFFSFAQNSKLAQTTITDNSDGTATVTATIVGDLTELSGENLIKVSVGKYTSDLIAVTSEQIEMKGENVMVIKINFAIDNSMTKDGKMISVEVYTGLKDKQGIFRRGHMQNSICASYENIIEEQLGILEANPLHQCQ